MDNSTTNNNNNNNDNIGGRQDVDNGAPCVDPPDESGYVLARATS